MIHTVGPIYDQEDNPDAKLILCYQNCLKLAKENTLQSVAFPAISTGVYGFPKVRAYQIAIQEIQHFLNKDPGTLQKIIVATFSESDAQIAHQALAEYTI